MTKKNICYALLLISFAALLSGCGIGASMDLFFQRFTRVSGTLTQLVTGITYFMGLIFAFRAVYALKHYGEMRTMMSSNANLKAPMTYFLIAAVFMYLPTAIQVVNETVYGSENPLTFAPVLGSYSAVMTGVQMFIRFIGLVSFVRGWMMLSTLAQQGQHQSPGKAFTHILGGVMAMNIQTTIQLLKGTFT